MQPKSWLSVVVISLFLCACGGSFSTAQPSTTADQTEIAAEPTRTLPAYPPVDFTPLPYPNPTYTPPAPYPVSAPDPEGQFTLTLPVGWEAVGPNRYAGRDGYVTWRYLPAFGYTPRATMVCEQLAWQDERGWEALLFSDQVESCLLRAPNARPFEPVQIILKLPHAPPEERYLLLETLNSYASQPSHSLPFQLTFKQLPNAAVYRPANDALRPEDETFWNQSAVWPEGMRLTEEDVIADEPGEAQDLLMRAHEKHLRATPARPWRADSVVEEPNAETVMAKFGFALEEEPGGSQPITYALLQDQRRLLGGIVKLETPILDATSQDFAIVLETADRQQWLLRKNGLTPWSGRPDYPQILATPILVNGDLWHPIWKDNRVQVLRNLEPVFFYPRAIGADNPIKLFTAWQTHWLMEANGALFQDGELLNETLGMDEIFGWRLLNNKAFFFFRKGPRVGAYYDGQRLPLAYEDIFHGGCCGYAMLNPGGGDYWQGFYGLKDGVWYWVEVGFTSTP